MDGHPTIGILCTSFGGHYHGRLIGGVAATVGAAGGRLIGVQTLDAGTFGVDLSSAPPFHHLVASRHIAGYVMILNSVDRSYLDALRAAGKPIVMISNVVPGFECPVVAPDNRVGIREAVTHLIEHGHRRIAFAGHPVQQDIRERYETYQATLREHGIEPDPALLFNTGNNQDSGGEQAARAMIAAGMPSTAVLTGNDFNAIGLLRTLADAGYEVPRDQAVVGFDDLDEAAYLMPSLASVRQPFHEVGAVAADLLLRSIAGQPPACEQYLVATSFLARQSCGCPDKLSLGTDGSGAPPIRSTSELAARLTASLLPGSGASGPAPQAVQAAAAIADTMRAAVAGGTDPGHERLHRTLAALYRLRPHPEAVAEVMRCVRSFGRFVAVAEADGTDQAAVLRVEDHAQEIIALMAQIQSRAQFRDSTTFIFTLGNQYRVSMDLLRSHEQDPRALGWLPATRASAACLGLWPAGRSGPGSGLDLVATYDRSTAELLPKPRRMTVADFPPEDLLTRADLDADRMVLVAPVKVGASDWGMFATVGPIEAGIETGREPMNQWTALLAIALEHESVLNSLREQKERLRHAALYDALTGLPNRVLFQERLRHAVARTHRADGSRYAVLLMDLDGFKIINDSLGHLVGDQLLVEVATRVRAQLREIDLAARLGGDEFAILLEDVADIGDAVAVAERVNAALRSPFRMEEQDVGVGSSIGIALGNTDYQLADQVLRDADIAMYWAKSRGKGSYAIFDVAMHATAVGRLRTEADLRRAVDGDELRVYFQPIVDLRTGRTTGLEALVRWLHPARGLVSPDEFLTVAEDSGLILPIGRWVLEEACRQARGWQASGAAPAGMRISVNVSNRQFWHGRLPHDVRECLRATRLDPRRLALEITEGVIMNDVEQARCILRELHDLGVQVHIDDFGTGHSSLQALHHLPIDALKIDRSFVGSLGVDSRGCEMVRTIVLMGRNLGLELIAEGIETQQQRDHLLDMGCTYGQGYLFSRPVPGEQVEPTFQDPRQRAAGSSVSQAGAGG